MIVVKEEASCDNASKGDWEKHETTNSVAFKINALKNDRIGLKEQVEDTISGGKIHCGSD